MSILKMKKTPLILVCILFSVFCLSSVSYSENDNTVLWGYQEELHNNYNKTRENHNDFVNILQTTKTADYTNIPTRIRYISNLLYWSSDMIVFFYRTYVLHYADNKPIIGRLIYIQKEIKWNLNYIDSMYDSVKATSLLHIIDKQKEITRSSLETLDKTIELMTKIVTKQSENKSK
jgi:hypothetical protein